MFLSSFDTGFDADTPLAGDMLAEIGVHPATVREAIAEDRALGCPDRDAVFPERRLADLYPAPACRPAARRWRRA